MGEDRGHLGWGQRQRKELLWRWSRQFLSYARSGGGHRGVRLLRVSAQADSGGS